MGVVVNSRSSREDEYDLDWLMLSATETEKSREITCQHQVKFEAIENLVRIHADFGDVVVDS